MTPRRRFNPDSPDDKVFTLGSLFAGIGGIELGLEMTGRFKTVWQVEQNEYCRKVLRRHWPDALQFEDVRDVGKENLPPVDVICGGFPCQDVSHANPRGQGLDGDRSGLWFQYARIIGELRPRFVVVENVAALVTDGLDRVLGTLAVLGYDARWSVLSACALGAPHTRERVFVAAHSDRIGFRAVSASARRLQTKGRPQLREPIRATELTAWAETHGATRGKANALPQDVDPIRALGNSVYPECARVIGEWLLEIDAELSEGAS